MTSRFSLVRRLSLSIVTATTCGGLLVACGKSQPSPSAAADKKDAAAHKGEQKGEEASEQTIRIDGSSTVLPISEAVAEEFEKGAKVRVTVASSGTGGGFKKFCNGEIDIAGASRPIKSSEAKACSGKNIAFIELPIAYDGLVVVTHKDNDWAKTMTVSELKKMWEKAAQDKVTKWSEVRPGWPDAKFNLFGAGVDSGTYDYFTKAITGEEHSSRGDYNSSEDDNILVKGISTDKNALGFFGFAYYEENKDKLGLVSIDDEIADNGAGPLAPSPQTIRDGTYQPLSRPIFIYVALPAAEKKHVTDFVNYYLEHGAKLSQEVGYVPLPDQATTLTKARFTARKTGSLFEDGSKTGVTIDKLLAAENSADAQAANK